MKLNLMISLNSKIYYQMVFSFLDNHKFLTNFPLVKFSKYREYQMLVFN
jgi:hypothetical protein